MRSPADRPKLSAIRERGSVSTVSVISPLVAVGCPRGTVGLVPQGTATGFPGWLGQWFDSSPVGGVGEADAVAGGEQDVGVVHEAVDEGGGDSAGHELVEP